MGSDRALKMGPIEWILLLVLSVLWSGSFFFAKLAVAELPPFTIVLGRVGLAALALNLLVARPAATCPRIAPAGPPFSPWARSTISFPSA